MESTPAVGDDAAYPLTNPCSISQQRKPGCFSVYGGGRFAENVLRHMPYSKTAGAYVMFFDPAELTLTIKFPK